MNGTALFSSRLRPIGKAVPFGAQISTSNRNIWLNGSREVAARRGFSSPKCFLSCFDFACPQLQIPARMHVSVRIYEGVSFYLYFLFQVAFSNSQAKKLAVYLSTCERHIDAVEKPNLDKEVWLMTIK